ncbi:MerR family transcriptional regulator [Kineosporia sp. J2-2]|uniref:MerR family transcriptional regulator n=1 Tax=Kineosporia corallincola TaxID=2835133 RepID=A0ABS5TG70_9ACTN|nr:MerR family transcriptional regulator [Kineosporia corallincola]MBT0770057.1 MerR family transcriptional regulator [Kineosporia corallincola]
MRIGEVAERAGVSVRAMRYYEEQGLVTADRSPSGHRRYAESAVVRVRFIQALYSAGLSSRTVAELLPIMDEGVITAQMFTRLDGERERIRVQIDELTQAYERLGQLIESGRQLKTPVVTMACD